MTNKSVNDSHLSPTLLFPDPPFSPRADIARELGFRSANAAEEHLRALARKGAIEMIPGASRGIKLPGPQGIPIVGQVAAGHPILAEEHIEDYYSAISPLRFSTPGPNTCFMSGE